jgi:thiol-disulfide isomerase/thioredoxin
MFTRPTWLILGLAVLAALLGGLWQRHEQGALAPANQAAVAALAVAQPLPPLQLLDMEGKPRSLADFRGKRLLINLWASWCQPCLDEMPALQRAHADGAQIVGIAMDEPARARAFLRQHPLDYPQLLGRLEPPSTALLLGNRQEVLPYSVLLDERGLVLATHTGVLDATTLRRWLDPERQAF